MAKKVKKNIVYQETYQKNVTIGNNHVIDFLKQTDVTVYVVNAGKYEDGKEFMTIIVDNI